MRVVFAHLKMMSGRSPSVAISDKASQRIVRGLDTFSQSYAAHSAP